MSDPTHTGPAGRPGRRAAPARRRAESRRRFGPGGIDGAGLLALGLVVMAGILVAFTPKAEPARTPATISGSLVDRTVLSCPDTDAQLRTETGIGLATAEGPLAELGADGTVLAGPLGGTGDPVDLRRGELVDTGDLAAPVVDASGDVAAGLFAFRGDRAQDGAARAVARCTEPRASWWFVGAGATLDHEAELTMANVDPAPAVVDVEVFGPTGEIETVGTRGITIRPGERVELPMTEIAPQRDDLVVHVEASRGRVAAAVLDQYASRPGADRGLAWLPAAERPARKVRLAGVHPAGREHTLLVGNPSDLEALVEVQVSGETGTFTPAGMEDLSVPPGSVVAVGLEELGGEAVAVRLSSRVPVVAVVRSSRGGDTSYAGAVDALNGPAAVPVVPGRTTVQLTAGDDPATVRVTGYDRDGSEAGEEELEVGATATATWRPPRGTDYAVVQPLDGSVYGAATYARPGLAQAGLVTLPVRVRQPYVAPGP